MEIFLHQQFPVFYCRLILASLHHHGYSSWRTCIPWSHLWSSHPVFLGDIIPCWYYCYPIDSHFGLCCHHWYTSMTQPRFTNWCQLSWISQSHTIFLQPPSTPTTPLPANPLSHALPDKLAFIPTSCPTTPALHSPLPTLADSAKSFPNHLQSWGSWYHNQNSLNPIHNSQHNSMQSLFMMIILSISNHHQIIQLHFQSQKLELHYQSWTLHSQTLHSQTSLKSPSIQDQIWSQMIRLLIWLLVQLQKIQTSFHLSI